MLCRDFSLERRRNNIPTAPYQLVDMTQKKSRRVHTEIEMPPHNVHDTVSTTRAVRCGASLGQQGAVWP